MDTQGVTRLEELKEKGWVYLNKEEKEEYKKLKTKGSLRPLKEEQTLLIKKEVKSSQKIGIGDDQLTRLLNRVRQLEAQAGVVAIADVGDSEWEAIEKSDHIKISYLVRWRKSADDPWGLCIGIKSVKPVKDPITSKIHDLIRLTLLKSDGETFTHEMYLTDFARIQTRTNVELVNEYKERKTKKVGKTVKRRVAQYEQYRSEPAPQVDQYVAEDFIHYDIKLPDKDWGGKVLEKMPQAILNL